MKIRKNVMRLNIQGAWNTGKWFGILVTALATGGCISLDRYEIFGKQDDVGSVHVAVLSVAPWDKYKKALQPKYELTAKQALAEAIRTTQLTEQTVLDVLEANLSLAPRQTSRTATSKRNRDLTQSSTSSVIDEEISSSRTRTATSTATDTTTDTTSDGDASKFSAPEISDSLSRPSDEELKRDGLSVSDPFTAYKAATALYQEVQLLNRYIQDAVIPDGYESHVVRLQITLMPKARNQPYDAYSNLSFFCDGKRETLALPSTDSLDWLNSGDSKSPAITVQNVEGPRATLKSEKSLSESELHNLERQLAYDELFRNMAKININHGSDETVFTNMPTNENVANYLCSEAVVIPLLVTDSVESSQSLNASRALRQLSFAISALQQGNAGSFGVTRALDAQDRQLGNDRNSILTVGRTSDNTLTIRIGAQYQGSVDYAMLPQTHNISVLVLTDKKRQQSENSIERNIQIMAKTEFVDVMKGTKTRRRTDQDVERIVRRIARRYDSLAVVDGAGMGKWNFNRWFLQKWPSLLASVQQNDFHQFNEIVKEPNMTLFAQDIWNEIVAQTSGMQKTSMNVKLPQNRSLPPTFPASQAVTIIDDEKKATVTLQGGVNLDAAKLSAVLCAARMEESSNDVPVMELSTDNTGEWNNQIPCSFDANASQPLFAATDVTVETKPNRIFATFPSIQKLGVSAIKLQLHYPMKEAEEQTRTFKVINLETKKPKTESDTKLVVRARKIHARKDATGDVSIVVINKTKDKKMLLDVEGADVASVKGNSKIGKGLIEILDDGQLDLSLKNLSSLVPVRIKAIEYADLKPQTLLRAGLATKVIEVSVSPLEKSDTRRKP